MTVTKLKPPLALKLCLAQCDCSPIDECISEPYASSHLESRSLKRINTDSLSDPACRVESSKPGGRAQIELLIRSRSPGESQRLPTEPARQGKAHRATHSRKPGTQLAGQDRAAQAKRKPVKKDLCRQPELELELKQSFLFRETSECHLHLERDRPKGQHGRIATGLRAFPSTSSQLISGRRIRASGFFNLALTHCRVPPAQIP